MPARSACPAPLRECKADRDGSVGQSRNPAELASCASAASDCSTATTVASTTTTGWLADGWFRTGDLARFDDRGWLYFVGRSKDIIRRNGENISAREVEQALETIDGIALASVVPVVDARRGEEVRACIVLRHGLGVDDVPPPVILDALAGRLATYKRPRFIDYFTGPCRGRPVTRSPRRCFATGRRPPHDLAVVRHRRVHRRDAPCGFNLDVVQQDIHNRPMAGFPGRITMTRFRTSLALLTCATLLAACGGGDDDSETTAADPRRSPAESSTAPSESRTIGRRESGARRTVAS